MTVDLKCTEDDGFELTEWVGSETTVETKPAIERQYRKK